MRATIPCVRVLRDVDGVQERSKEQLKCLRADAWNIVKERQQPLLPNSFQMCWTLWLILVFAACIALSIINIANNHFMVPSYLACGLSIISYITACLVFLLLAYRPHGEPIISHFYIHQIQHYVGELGLYTQLCVFSVLSPYTYDSPISVPVVVLCAITLFTVIVLRIHSIVSMKRWLGGIFAHFMIFTLGTHAMNILWLAALTAYSKACISLDDMHIDNVQLSPNIATMPVAALSLFVAYSSTANTAMFYIAHMYEISLQSALIVHRHQEENTWPHVRMLTGLPTFHKNMFPMASGLYGTVLFFWTIPFIAVITVCLVHVPQVGLFRYIMIGASLCNVLVNYKAFLLSCSGFMVILTVVLLFIFCTIAGISVFGLTLLSPIFFLGFFIVAIFMIMFCDKWVSSD